MGKTVGREERCYVLRIRDGDVEEDTLYDEIRWCDAEAEANRADDLVDELFMLLFGAHKQVSDG